MPKHNLQDSSHVLQYIPVREPQDYQPFCPKIVIPDHIVLHSPSLVVLRSIDLNDQLGLRAIEVDYVITDDLLPVELGTTQLLSSNP